MERIAEALDVAVGTVHKDLRDFSPSEKSKHSKTQTNPRADGP
jgi:hypothetical protein